MLDPVDKFKTTLALLVGTYGIGGALEHACWSHSTEYRQFTRLYNPKKLGEAVEELASELPLLLLDIIEENK